MGYLEVGRDIAGLSGTYTVERALPESGFGSAFVARDANGRRVLLKEAHVGDPDAWKRVEALEREARTTLHLAAARIPGHLGLFAYDGERAKPAAELTRGPRSQIDGAPSLILVRAFVPGRTLAEAVVERRRFTAAELEVIFRDLLETRRYLDALLPPVVHGDVSPSNVVVDDDGHAWLIDFGAVSEDPKSPPSAAVGTSGYMPLEQLAGRPTPASDLFASAMTVLTAASHRAAHDIPTDPKTMRIPIEAIVTGLPVRFTRALAACLEPSSSERARCAAEVLFLLEGGTRVGYRARRLVERPSPRLLRGALVGGAVLASLGSSALPWVVALHARRHAPVASVPIVVPGAPLFVGVPPIEPAPPSAPADPPPAPPAPPPPPSFLWVGKVTEARGDLHGGDACSLEIVGDPSDTSAGCTVSLHCGDRAVLKDEVVPSCAYAETTLGPETSEYRAVVTRERADGTPSTEISLDGRTGAMRVTSTSATGEVLDEVRVQLSGASLPTTSGRVANRRFVKRSHFDGTLVRVAGAPHAKKGDACSYDLSPIQDSDPFESPEQNCRAIVKCGGAVLYDGYGSCSLDAAGKPIDVSDADGTPADGDPTLAVVGHELTVGDTTPDRKLDALVYLDQEPVAPEE